MKVIGPQGLQKPRVLLADDEESLRIVLRRVLGQLGFDVVAVANGAQAVSAFLEAPTAWRLVLLDVMMPVMGGVRAYESIRAHSPSLPVLLCSGYNTEAIGPALERDSHLRFLDKPFDVHTLTVTLASLGALPALGIAPVLAMPAEERLLTV